MNEYEKTIEIVREAGLIMKSGYSDVREKSDGTFVTDADLRVQDFLIRSLPDIPCIAEEQENPDIPDECFIIDPIDGTHNYMNGIPFCAVCVAHAVDRRVEEAFVYNPFLEQFFSAKRGGGAFLNGERIEHGPVLPMEETALLTESWRFFDYQVFIENFHRFRCIGSAELGLCYAAMSSAVYISHWAHLWDYAAGKLIANEAGLDVFEQDGKDARLMEINEIAACPAVQKEEMLRVWGQARKTDEINRIWQTGERAVAEKRNGKI